MTPAEYDAWYDSPRGRWIGETEFRLLQRLLALRPGETLLDVGCGSGWFTRRFAAAGDCGVTGRKIIVDTYGGKGSHGGGAFSGKDPSKVDRSSAYYGRYLAKNIVAAGIADEFEVQVAYAIGISQPVSINVNSFGTGKISDEKIKRLITEHFDLRPKAIVQQLNLLRPIYLQTAAYGHFGRELDDFTWEKTDKADLLRDAANLR